MPRVYTRLNDDERIKRNRERAREWREQNPGRVQHEPIKSVFVPQYVREDAERRRNLQPRSLGDPLPGYSALDRKMRQT